MRNNLLSRGPGNEASIYLCTIVLDTAHPVTTRYWYLCTIMQIFDRKTWLKKCMVNHKKDC